MSDICSNAGCSKPIPRPWTDLDHPDPVLDAAYRSGIVPAAQRQHDDRAPDGPAVRIDQWHPEDNSLSAVFLTRQALWTAGYRPIPVYTTDKRPLGTGWTDLARGDPPAGAIHPAVPAALNTGILTDELRALDGDIDDPDIAVAVRTAAERDLGPTIMRYRSNSARFLLLYRAAQGAPAKSVLQGRHGKLEVLGYGQQFVAFGLHPSGASLQWSQASPGPLCRRHVLPMVSEDQIATFFAAMGPIIEVAPPKLIPSPQKLSHSAVGLSRYGEAILDSSWRKIVSAPDHQRDYYVNSVSYSCGRLVGGGVLPHDLTLGVLHDATRQIPGFDPRRDPSKVERSFANGLDNPHDPREARA